MGSWSVSCGISNISITSGQECYIIPLNKSIGDYGGYLPFTLPILGKYNDYGGMEDIVQDENTKIIEEYLGITIDEFVEYLVDGEFTYDRDEAKATKEKIKLNGKLNKQVIECRFMWVDKQVYDVMKVTRDEHEKGHHDFGTPEMLKLLGFTIFEDESEIVNYDPKRFKKKYKKGDVILYSDGRTLLSSNNKYIYYTNEGSDNSLATYIDIPEELKYLEDKTSFEAWRLMSPRKIKSTLGTIFGNRENYDDELIEILRKKLIERGGEVPVIDKVISEKYFDNIEEFGDSIVELSNVRKNMHCMSSRFYPHTLYLTPQCGDYETHQILLEEFSKINKSYCEDYD